MGTRRLLMTLTLSLLLVLGLGLNGCGDDGNGGDSGNDTGGPGGGPVGAGVFIDNGNATVTNTLTRLQWQLPNPGYSMFYSNPGGYGVTAEEYCQNLNLNGFGWRLPTRSELISLLDVTRGPPTIVDPFRPSTLADAYWTSDPSITPLHRACVFFNLGKQGDCPAGISYQVRCCR